MAIICFSEYLWISILTMFTKLFMDYVSLMIPFVTLISQIILLFLILITILVSTTCLSHVSFLSVLIAVSSSCTVLIVSFYLPTHSPIFIFLLIFFLHSSLPLPCPIGTVFSVLVLSIHIIIIYMQIPSSTMSKIHLVI